MGSRHTPPRWWKDQGAENTWWRWNDTMEGYGPLMNAIEAMTIPLRWKTYHVSGCEVLDLQGKEIPWFVDLEVGTVVDVPTTFGIVRATVTGPRLAETEHTLCVLERATDFRACWTSSYSVNKASINKIRIASVEG